MHNISVRNKLFIGFAVVLALLATMAALSLRSMGKIDDDMRDLMEDRYPKIELSNSLMILSLDNGRQVRNTRLLESNVTQLNIRSPDAEKMK